MIATSHILTGACIAVTFKNGFIAVIVSLLSHFILDAFPHFGMKEEWEKLKRSWLLRAVVLFEIICVSAAFLYLPAHLDHIVSAPLIVVCMTVAILPDFMWPYRYAVKFFTKGKYIFTSRIMHFHESIQRFEKPLGITVEAVWMAIVLTPIVRLL